MPRALRRLLLWTFVCVVSAAPSFHLAHADYDRAAMAVGVVLFIAAYTASTSTDAFERFHRRPFVRRTLYVGYGLRVGLSIAFPLGVAADMIPGMVSIGLVQNLLGLEPRTFAGTLATTVVQGTFLNVIIGLFMLFVYAVQRAFLRPPEERLPPGFEVVLPPKAAETIG